MEFPAPALIASAAVTQASSDKLEYGSTKNLARATATAIKDLGKKLQAGIRKEALVGQNLARHRAALGFLKSQISRQEGGISVTRKIFGAPQVG